MSSIRSLRVYRFGGFRLDAERRLLNKDGAIVALPPKAVDTLTVLVENAGEVVDKETLFRLVWPDTFVAESSLTKNICLLRKSLDDPASGESAIQTVSKRGYRFAATVDIEPAVAAPISTPAWRGQTLGKRAAQFAAIAGLVLVAAIVYGRWQPNPSEVLTESDRQYLLGQHMLNKFERSELHKALDRFRRATELQPQSALAHAGVADTYTVMTTFGIGDQAMNLRSARTAAERAIELDPKLARAHVNLGRVKVLAEFDFAGAEREYLRALEARSEFGCGSSRLCVSANPLRKDKRGTPGDETCSATGSGFAAHRCSCGSHRVHERRYQHAVGLLQEVLEREPSFSQAHYYMAMTLGELGQVDEALAHLRQARLNPSLLAEDEAWLSARKGDLSAARQLMKQRRLLVADNKAEAGVLLLPAIAAGNTELAMWSLQEMSRTGRIELLSARLSPRLDALRPDPRFTALIQRIGQLTRARYSANFRDACRALVQYAP